ncbi:MAG: aminopeptidase P family protein [Verrucomicrobia bacterium]|nr:aminopeptidase P family protein [Verrucomicrobiota bacterium]MCH8526799.1 Xaa-Pro peptidase family protein [Kiritimatiellia bacterium]
MKSKKSTSALLLIGAGADAVDVRYASGFSAPDPFLYVQTGDEKCLLVSPLEIGRALKLGPSVTCATPDDYGMSQKARRDLGRQAAVFLAALGCNNALVSPRCPIGVVRRLEKKGLNVKVVKDPVFAERSVKTPKEIRALRQAQRATADAMKAAVALIAAAEIGKDGGLKVDGAPLTSERVRHAVCVRLLEKQFHAEEIIIAGGDQGTDPHERGHGPLRAGEMIVLDIFPRSETTGYWGDMTRTVIRGRPTPEQRRQYRTVLAAQKAALARVAAGVTGAEIHQAVCDVFAEAGYETGRVDGVPQGFIHSTGHGVGLEIHEAPSVSPAGGPLAAGQVITIEPGLYYPGVGGVRIEDTVLVTETGCTLLATCPKRFML